MAQAQPAAGVAVRSVKEETEAQTEGESETTSDEAERLKLLKAQ